jgi:hypothetical protein
MGKTLFIQNSFENPWLKYGIPRCRYGSGEMEYGVVFFLKNAHCVLVLTEQPITCATTFTPIWGGA